MGEVYRARDARLGRYLTAIAVATPVGRR